MLISLKRYIFCSACIHTVKKELLYWPVGEFEMSAQPRAKLVCVWREFIKNAENTL